MSMAGSAASRRFENVLRRRRKAGEHVMTRLSSPGLIAALPPGGNARVVQEPEPLRFDVEGYLDVGRYWASTERRPEVARRSTSSKTRYRPRPDHSTSWCRPGEPG